MPLSARNLPQRWFLVLMAVTLAAASLSTKAAGVFWFVLLLAGLFVLATGRRHLPGEGETPGLARALTGWWLFFCLLALALKAIPVLYWAAPWEERHAEFRLLLGALGVWLIARHARPRIADGGVLGHGLAVACTLALALVLVKTSDGAPTNRIPWAAGVSLLSCTLLYASYAIKTVGLRAPFWRFASFLALVAVAFSGVRGSYLLIVLWPLMFLMLHLHYAWQHPVATRPWGWLLVPVSIGVIGWTGAHLSANYFPHLRVHQAFHESLILDVNSASGARIVMWQAAAQAIGDNPILGHGYLGGKGLLRQTAENTQSSEIARLGHFHSDYLHAAVEFGLLGLASYLCFAAGLVVMAVVCLRRKAPTVAIGLAGILAMHASTGLTNVNFAHNYYPTLLSLCVSLVLLSCAMDRPRESVG